MGPGPHGVLPGVLTGLFYLSLFFFLKCTIHTAILPFLNELSLYFLLPTLFKLLH